MQTILKIGCSLNQSIPFINWEPRDTYADVAAGDDDAQLTAWAAGSVRYGHPFYLRMWPEFTGSWEWYYVDDAATAKQLVAAWQHVVTLFRDAGATNVMFVWSMGYSGTLTYLPDEKHEENQ